MKKLILLILIFTGAVIFTNAQGYYSNYKGNNQPSSLKINFGVDVGASVGTVSNYYPGAGGLTIGLEAPIKKTRLSVLFTTGYTFYASSDGYYDGGYGYGYDGYGYGYGGDSYVSSYVADFIPVELGLKAYLFKKLFVEGNAGVSINVNTYPHDYTNKTAAFMYAPGLGYSFPLGFRSENTFDLSLFYESRPDSGGGYNQISLRAAYSFGL